MLSWFPHYRSRVPQLQVEAWGLETGPDGVLLVDGCSTVELAHEHGTPLHVVHEARLRRTVQEYIGAFQQRYAGRVEPFYALKCNGVPGVVAMVLECGARPEVMSEYEYWLARKLGVPPSEILVNGPNKPERFLRTLVSDGVKLVVVDSLFELDELERIASGLRREVDVLLRLNPDYTPFGMNSATATASRAGAVFGLDLRDGEERLALDRCARSRYLRYRGIHVHIGTGCKRAADYSRAFERFRSVMRTAAQEHGLRTEVLDFGGGFGSTTAREYRTAEFLAYLALGRLPGSPRPSDQASFAEFAEHICSAIETTCERDGLPLPSLILEPGRSLVSVNVLLLMTVNRLKADGRRPGRAVTDGGMWTTTFPPTVEYHEVFSCRRPRDTRTMSYCLTGSTLFGRDQIIYNKTLPPLQVGDVLALMDAGAYFSAMESNVGRPRPACVAVSDGRARLLRRRETTEDMLARDLSPRRLQAGPAS